VNGSVVRTLQESPRAWRLRQWPNDPSVAHLVFLDHLKVPRQDDIDAALRHARRRGARAVRTSAMFPRAADIVLGAGFEPIDRLVLLRYDLATLPEVLPAPTHRTRPMLAWHHHEAARVDRDAFGPMWGNDAASLRDIRHATPVHRARLVRVDRDLAAIAISGAAGDSGYLQRLAVATAHRRRGIARDLVLDALGWMRRRGLSTALVNTGVNNAAALALYEGLGFVHLDEQLTIAERRLTA
jgi:ribosomal protein S18 acetylase RimI-like enzyme